MKKISIHTAERSQIDWINTIYSEIGFATSTFDNEFIVIAQVDNQNAGLGRLVQIDHQNIELGGIYSFPEYRGMKVAHHIVSALCDKNPFQNATFWCLPFENLAGFYTKFGFQHHSERVLPVEIERKLLWCNTANRYEKTVIVLCKDVNSY